MKLADDDVALAWLPRHQADQINRYKVGDDGKTPEQRRPGKRWRKPALEFGERVMIREAQTSQQRHRTAFEAKMIYGRYIGHHGRTGALLVLTEDEVKRGVGVRRLAIQERWNKEGWDKLRGLPWDVKSRETLSPTSSTRRTTGLASAAIDGCRG